ncbi:helix-turn-helix domain-containing protein [Micromonospora sp. NPDC049366]|uniref:helix-turn-helix domain-containing protein n=1 Tax=Micromonospora sp. NPDC049366 TaxID=3364271 RepID=UPI0037AF2256
MSITEAAEEVGVSAETVRRWVDDAEARGEPVAERERDGQGRAIPRSWRRPYRDAVAEWKRRRQPAPPSAAG